eukprot:gene11192-4012_t
MSESPEIEVKDKLVGKRSETTIQVLGKKTLGLFDKWTTFYYQIGENLYFYKKENDPKPTLTIKLQGAFIRFVRDAESQASFKKKNVLEVQVPLGVWRLGCANWDEYFTLGQKLREAAHKFSSTKKVITVDSALERNFIKELQFSSVFDAMVHASSGQTIEIKEGVYREEIPIVKSVRLVGLGNVEIQTPDLQKVLSEGLVTGFSNDPKYPAACATVENITFNQDKPEKKLNVAHLQSGYIMFKKCTFMNGECGVKMSGNSAAYFQDCTFTKNRTYGLYTVQSCEGILERCSVVDNLYDGINMSEYSLVDLRETIVEKNGYNGILVGSKYRLVLEESIVKENSWDGVVIEHKETTFVLGGNTFSSNTGHGLYFVKGKPDNLYFEVLDLDYDSEYPTRKPDDEEQNKLLREKNTFESNGKSDIN